MIVGLLNGCDRYALDGAYIRVARVIESSVGVKAGVVLERIEDDRSRSWTTAIDDLWSDPTSSNVRSLTADYQAHFWRRAGLFAVAGESKMVLVDIVSGAIVDECPLEFVGSSMDVLQLIVNRSESVLVVVSAFLVVAWNDDRSRRWEWKPESLISDMAEIGGERDRDQSI